MKFFYIPLILLILVMPSVVYAAIPGLVDVGNGEVRYLGFIKVYDASLYTQPDISRANILEAGTSRCLVIDYSVSLSAEDLVKGGEKVLARQHDKQRLDKIRNHIDTLHNSYQDIDSGDSYTLCYNSATEVTTLLYNSDEVVDIKSSEFANVYFGIWLGPKKPIDDDLRDDLLKRLPEQTIEG